MKQKNLFALTLLTAAALFVASCKDNDNWKPTFAVPLVKEMKMRISEFMDAGQVEDFNQRIKQIWVDYVTEEIADGNPAMVDTVAYKIITDTAHHYVNYGETSLNQATIDSLLARGVDSSQIAEINTFLSDYSEGNPTTEGNAAMNNLLLGVVGSSTDVFVTAANMMEYLEKTQVGESYAEDINKKLDTVLMQTNMDDFIDLDMSELTQKTKVMRIEFDMDIENTTPFNISFSVKFVRADSVSVQDVFDESLDDTPVNSKRHPHFESGSNLGTAIDETKKIRLKVDCSKGNKQLTPPVLRTLGEKGVIARNMRVKVQTGLNQ